MYAFVRYAINQNAHEEKDALNIIYTIYYMDGDLKGNIKISSQNTHKNWPSQIDKTISVINNKKLKNENCCIQ